MAEACEKPDGSQVPAVQDLFAGEIFEHITAEYGACAAVEAVHKYYSNIGEYGLQDAMDPRAFVQFIQDSRLLAEDFSTRSRLKGPLRAAARAASHRFDRGKPLLAHQGCPVGPGEGEPSPLGCRGMAAAL